MQPLFVQNLIMLEDISEKTELDLPCLPNVWQESRTYQSSGTGNVLWNINCIVFGRTDWPISGDYQVFIYFVLNGTETQMVMVKEEWHKAK